jgi:hypothetical protein
LVGNKSAEISPGVQRINIRQYVSKINGQLIPLSLLLSDSRPRVLKGVFRPLASLEALLEAWFHCKQTLSVPLWVQEGQVEGQKASPPGVVE